MPITVICGHYGCGKTNLALNLALEAVGDGPATQGTTVTQGTAVTQGTTVTLVDLDIVNPYFRSSDYAAILKNKGVRLIAPVFAGTTLDTPTLPPEIQSVFTPEAGRVFIDAGGDDAGATALGGLSPGLIKAGYELIYVINRYRVLSQTPEECAALLSEIEGAARLRASGIVNNSHLGVETKMEHVLDALDFAKRTAELTGLPLLYSTVPDFALNGEEPPEGFRTVRRLVKFAWE